MRQLKSKFLNLFFILFLLIVFNPLLSNVNGNNLFLGIENNTAYNSILKLYNQGVFENIINIKDMEFSPDNNITRIEFLACILNADGFKGTTVYEEPPLADYADAPDVLKNYLKEGYYRKIFMGKRGNKFNYFSLNDDITGEEAFAMLTNMSPEYLNLDLNFDNESLNSDDKITLTEASIILSKLMKDGFFNKNTMKIYAGTSKIGYKNGGRLVSSFISPRGISLDNDENILIADSGSNMIRIVTKEEVKTIAGRIIGTNSSGLPLGGYKDRVNALEAILNEPKYLTVSENGDIYFTEYQNNMVRVISQEDGQSYAFSGNNESGYENGERSETRFNSPGGIAIDENGIVYVADTLNNCIRTIDKDGNSALFGGIPGDIGGYQDGNLLEAQFNEPTGISCTSDGSLYIADSGNSLIRKISDGQVTTIAGTKTRVDRETNCMVGGFLDGDASSALFKSPKGIFVAEDGIVYVADTGNNRIRKISNEQVVTIAGNGDSSSAMSNNPIYSTLNKPHDLVYTKGKIYFTDSLNNCIKILTENN